MNSVTVLPRSQNMIEAIASLCVADEYDYSSAAVVFPGKRPAHVLRKTLADRLQSTFIPPRIFSIDDFIEYLLRELPGAYGRNLETADALALLYEIHTNVREKIGEDHYLTLDAFVPVGIKLFGELEELAMAMITPLHLRTAMANISFIRFHALSEYYEKFYAAVERQGFLTRSLMYGSMADQIEEIDLGAFSQVMIAGFFAFTTVEKKILTGLRQYDRVRLIFRQGKGLSERLAELGINFEQDEHHVIPSPNVHFISAPDLHGQVFALAAQLQSRIDEAKPMTHRVGVILPSSDALFPVYHHALSLIPGEQYNIAMGYPVIRTPAFGFLASLMALSGSELEGTYSAAEYLRFLLHPYTKNIKAGARSDITRIMVHVIEEELARGGILQLSLEEIEQNDDMLLACMKRISRIEPAITVEAMRSHLKAIHDQTIRKFSRFTSINDCMKRVKDALLYIFGNSTAYLHPYFQPYVEQLIDALDRVSNSLLSQHRFEEQEGYFTFLRHILAVESVPFSGTPLKGVQVLGLLETRNLSFDTLYMLDMNDDVIPGKPEADLLLPQQVRMILGLETYREREKLIEYYFDSATAGAKDVYFFYTASGSGKKEKSRYIEKLLWQEQQREKSISMENYEEKVKYRVYLANERPAAITKTEAMIAAIKQFFKFSATALDTYLDCQLKFYYRYVVKLEEKEEASEDPDELLIGTIVHKILAEYFKPFIGKSLAGKDLTQERLEEIVNACFTTQFGRTMSGKTLIIRKQVLEHLISFLHAYQKPLLENSDVTLLSLEEKFQVEKRGYSFTGKIDRIEQRGDAIVIIDYKTSHEETKFRIRLDELLPDDATTWERAIGSFQLPMYMFLYHEEMKKDIEDITPVYLFLGKANIAENIEVGIGTGENNPANVYKEIEKTMFNVIEEIVNPEKDFHPTPGIEKHCPHCPYHYLCGTQWVVSRRKF